MKLTVRAFLTCVICLMVISAALAKKPGAQTKISVTGVWENFTVGKESGDLEGMRVVIVPAGGSYYAIVQIAQGGAEDPKPEFVPAKVLGPNVSFMLGDEQFVGTVTAAGLKLKSSGGESQLLKQKPCFSYFK